MPLLRPVKLTFDLNSQRRVVLSIYEQPNGRLIIKSTGGVYYRELNHQRLPVGPLVPKKQQKYSIHPSKLSREYNQLHHSIVLEGETKNTYHVTSAIKSADRFAFIFARRTPNLQHDAYNIVGSADEKYLGRYNGSTTIISGVFVSNRENELTDLGDDYDYVQLKFANATIVFIWSFLQMRPLETGVLYHNTTLDPASARNIDEKRFLRSVMTGFSADEVVPAFKYVRSELRFQFMEELNMKYPYFVYEHKLELTSYIYKKTCE